MTETPVLDRPAEPAPATAAATGPLADLILVRLLPPAKSPPSPKKVRDDITPFFRTPPTPEQVSEVMNGLRAAGLMKPLGQHLTDAGRDRALAYLGIRELPAKVNFGTIKAKFLVPKALGVSAGTLPGKNQKDKLAAVLLKQRLELPAGTELTLTKVFEAIVCRVLGYPDEFKLTNLRSAVLSSHLKEKRTLSKADLERAVPAHFLTPPGKGVDGLRKLALKGFADAAPATPARQPEPQPDETFDLEDFANTVLSVARKSPTGRFGDNKVFISHVWRQLADEPRFARLGEAGFKAKLVEANRADRLTLSRADLYQALDPTDLNESEVTTPAAVFHFIFIEKE